MYKPVDVIKVTAWGQVVGAVARDQRQGVYLFEYDQAWRRHGVELAPLTMPVRQTLYRFPLLPEATFKRLPPLLADALPDDFGNALIDAYLAQQGVSKDRITALDRLAYMAKRAMGCLEFQPARSPRKTRPTAVAISELVTASRHALSGRFDGDRETEAALLNLIQVGTSAGGARAKAVIAWNPVTQEIRSGQLPVDDGFEPWLLKLDGIGKDAELGTGGHYGRIEYAYHLMARAAGIHMSDCTLLHENGRAHFMTRRFDREHDQKHHIATLCAMNALDYKQRGTHDYSQYFEVIRRLGLGPEALEEGYRRMVFNVLAANCDDHTKNLSFLLKHGGEWELAPAYDITHAFNPAGEWTYQHLMSVNGKFRNITDGDLHAVADRFLVPRYRDIIRQVKDAVREWEMYADAAHLPEQEAQKIRSDLHLMAG